ncbi:MAG: hypothetical protein WCH75_15160, partial [Candidatus Binatia bacterium]
GEVRRAGRVIGEPRLERGARHRAIVFPAARHARTLREQTGSVNASTQSVGGAGIKGISRIYLCTHTWIILQYAHMNNIKYFKGNGMKSLLSGIFQFQINGRERTNSKKLVTFLTLSSLIFSAAACSSVEKARKATDIVIANKNSFNLEALVQAETERQRIRKLRCHSPFLNPMAISGAAFHPSLGRAWVDELLRDCPEYSAFIADIVLRRAENAGIEALRGVNGHAE